MKNKIYIVPFYNTNLSKDVNTSKEELVFGIVLTVDWMFFLGGKQDNKDSSENSTLVREMKEEGPYWEYFDPPNTFRMFYDRNTRSVIKIPYNYKDIKKKNSQPKLNNFARFVRGISINKIENIYDYVIEDLIKFKNNSYSKKYYFINISKFGFIPKDLEYKNYNCEDCDDFKADFKFIGIRDIEIIHDNYYNEITFDTISVIEKFLELNFPSDS